MSLSFVIVIGFTQEGLAFLGVCPNIECLVTGPPLGVCVFAWAVCVGWDFLNRTDFMNDVSLENFLKAVEFSRLLESLAKDCQTPAGRNLLFQFRPLADEKILRDRLARTEQLEKHLIRHSALSIPRAEDFQASFEETRLSGKTLSAVELAALSRFLANVVKLRQYLSLEQNPAAAFTEWLERLQALPVLREFLGRKISEQALVLDSASAELKSVRDRLKSLQAEVQDYYRQFLQKADFGAALQEKIVTEREGRLGGPVKRDHQGQVPGFVHGISASGSTVFVEPQEIVERNNQVRETLLREDEEIRKVLRECTQAVQAVAAELSATLEACAEIDAHGVLALFASRF